MTVPLRVRATAPGRVNLIGDHTDYMGGLVLPMAIRLATTVEGVRTGGVLQLTSDLAEGTVRIPLPVADAASVRPRWGRYVAGVAAQLGSTTGFVGHISSTLPTGSGLSSSAALEVACALALGDDGTPLEIARRCRQAEQRATGVPCGIMDQLASAAGVEGHALLIDCARGEWSPVPVADGFALWVVHSGERRGLSGSAYAQRRAQCEAAQREVGPLPSADPEAIRAISDPVQRARARHVRTECDRVRAFASAMARGDCASAGRLMVDSHRSLRDDFEVSTPALDSLVDTLLATPGVHGARLTGAGFGGCVVALADPEVHLADLGTEAWRVSASQGATLTVLDDG